MATDPWAIDPSGGLPAYAAGETRLLTVVPSMIGAGASLGIRSGVRYSGSGTDLLVAAQASPNMTVKVNPGVLAVQGAISATQGAYTWVQDTLVSSLTISASHATLDRTDLVVVRIRDANVDTSGARDGSIIVITGTPGGGTPSLPVDATYFTLASISVPHTVTNIGGGGGGVISDKRLFTAALGGTIPYTSANVPSGLAAGDVLYNVTTGAWWHWNGAALVLDRPDTAWTDISGQSGLLTATGTNPVIGTGGNAKLYAGWRYIAHKLIMEQFTMCFGSSGPSQGSGNWRVAVPTGHNLSTANDGGASSPQDSVGTGWIYNTSTQKAVNVRKISTTAVEFFALDGTGFVAGGAGAWPSGTWGVGFALSCQFTYTEA